MADFVKCEAGDQGGPRDCPIPATLMAKPMGGGNYSYYCHEHKTNRHVWCEDELDPMTPTLAMVQGLGVPLE